MKAIEGKLIKWVGVNSWMGLLIVMALLTGGCATMGGVDTTTVPGERKVVDIKEDALPAINDLAMKYIFQQSKGDSWLSVEIRKVLRQTTIIHSTYESQDTYKKTLKPGKDAVLLSEWGGVAMGGILTVGTLTAKVGQPDWGGNIWTNDEITQTRAAGLGITGLSAIALIVDYLNLDGGRGDVKRTTMDNKKQNDTDQGVCAGCIVKLDLGKNGQFSGKANADGRAYFNLTQLGALNGGLNQEPWGQLVATDGVITAKTDVQLDPVIKAAQVTALEQKCLDSVSRLMDAEKWQEAYSRLQTCGDQAGAQRLYDRLRGHLRVTDKDAAYKLYAPRPDGLQSLVLNPASIKGAAVEVPVQILQKLDTDAYLVMLSADHIFYMERASNSNCPFDFVSNQPLKVLAVVDGSYTYMTTNSGSNTVTKLRAIWVQSFQ